MADKLSVLIVDDNMDLLETMNDILSASGFEVDVADDGLVAIEKFKTRAFDIAVLDIQMPGLNGVDTLREIRKTHPDTRFVVMTGYTDTEQVAEARSENLAGLLSKPVRVAELVSLLKSLRNAPARPPEPGPKPGSPRPS